MSNKSLLILIFIGIAASLLGDVLYLLAIPQFGKLLKLTSAAGRIGGFTLFARNEKLTEITYLFYMLMTSLIIVAVGMAKRFIYHSETETVLIVGLAGILLTYSMYFFFHKEKNHLEVLKFLWVASFFATLATLFLHLPFKHEVMAVEKILFIILFADYAYMTFKKGESVVTETEQ